MNKTITSILHRLDRLEAESQSRQFEDIYGCSKDQVPMIQGFESTGELRSPKAGEWYLSTGGGLALQEVADGGCGPRLILKRIEPEKPLRLVFDIVDMDRPPRDGELYRAEDGRVVTAGYDHCHPKEFILAPGRLE